MAKPAKAARARLRLISELSLILRLEATEEAAFRAEAAFALRALSAGATEKAAAELRQRTKTTALSIFMCG
jgi:hypothetical protein